MTKFLLIAGAKATAAAVFAVTAFCFLVIGEGHALSALLFGALASLLFLLLIWLGGRLLEPTTRPATKVVLFVLILGKFLIGGLLVWLLVTYVPVTGLGMALGIGAALTGFTLGLNMAIRSPEGEHVIRGEEKRLADQHPPEDPPA
ncbi:MAG: hypothetical protein HY791_29545 [Deltaproteobacteria bacterium]|nr:hypothetical protein [Deltaproteobacteria bacterium]